jgi:hypothetical protein
MRFSVPSGRRFSIAVGHEKSGKLDFPIPTPIGPGVRLVSRRGAIITYQARVAGVTQLIARHTIYCADRHGRRFSSCTAAVVSVTGH